MKYVFLQPDMRVANWRSIWPAKELRRRGYDVDIYAGDAARPAIEATEDLTYVVHFVNKAWNLNGNVITVRHICEIARDYGRLIVSFDDDWTRLLDIEPRPLNPLAKIVHQDVPECAKLADKIIVATPRLKEVFGGWGVCEVAENYLPEKYLRLKTREKLDRIAWMGIMSVHGRDWDELQPYAKELPPLTLLGAGQWAADKIKSWGAADVLGTDPTAETGRLYREMSRYRLAMIPLADTTFNRGKSWIKPMEFMAQEVPVVSMWHPEYERLNEKLGGMIPLFRSPEELVAATVEAWEQRRFAGKHLRERLLAEDLTMEKAGGDAWEKAIV